MLVDLLPRNHQGGQVRVSDPKIAKQDDKTLPTGIDCASATYLLFKRLRRTVTQTAFRLRI